MPDLRKPSSQLLPAYEDAGLFKNELCQLTVELVPQMSRNDRGDLRVRGYANLKLEIEVLFAGRRLKEIAALEFRLKEMLKRARQALPMGTKATLDVNDLRLPVRIEGAWRSRFWRDAAGWETRNFHLVAARWSMLDRDGNSVTFGAPPAN